MFPSFRSLLIVSVLLCSAFASAGTNLYGQFRRYYVPRPQPYYPGQRYQVPPGYRPGFNQPNPYQPSFRYRAPNGIVAPGAIAPLPKPNSVASNPPATTPTTSALANQPTSRPAPVSSPTPTAKAKKPYSIYPRMIAEFEPCLLYTSDAADE